MKVIASITHLDTETTGLHLDRRAWEIALIRDDVDGTSTRRLIQVSDVDLTGAEERALEVGGFRQRHVSAFESVEAWQAANPDTELMTEAEAAVVVDQITRGTHISGAMIHFDAYTLRPMLDRYGIEFGWHYHFIEIEALALGYLAARGQAVLPPWRSDDLTVALGLPKVLPGERHTAMGDTEWAKRVYDHIMVAS